MLNLFRKMRRLSTGPGICGRCGVIQFDFNTMSISEAQRLAKLNDRSVKAAQMTVAAIPILLVYPYLQKYFVAGIRLGSVKG